MMKRISYIDGLKGLACILVFVNHFLMSFFPASYLGGDTVSHITGGLDTYYATSPFSFITNGNFWVCVFFILSAYILSLKIFRNSDSDNALESISNSFIKRYFRLSFPVFCICVLILIFTRLGWFFNGAAAAITGSGLMLGRYEHPLSLYELISCSFAKIWFQSDETFSNSFWMLSTLFLGGFMSCILSIMAGKRRRRMLFLYGFFALILLHLDSLYLSFVLGTSLAYITARYDAILERIRQSVLWRIIAALCLFTGLFLGGYPSGVVPENIYRYLNHLPSTLTPYKIYHIIGAFLLVLAVLCLPLIQRALSLRPMLFLGDISFAVYLLNLPLIFSFSSGMLLWIIRYTDQYIFSSFLIFLSSAALLVLCSFLFHHYVEPICDKATSVIVSFFKLS